MEPIRPNTMVIDKSAIEFNAFIIIIHGVWQTTSYVVRKSNANYCFIDFMLRRREWNILCHMSPSTIKLSALNLHPYASQSMWKLKSYMCKNHSPSPSFHVMIQIIMQTIMHDILRDTETKRHAWCYAWHY